MLELRKGTEIEDRYVVHDVIGAGRFGTVWKASDKQLNRDVAIKRLLKTTTTPVDEETTIVLTEARKNAQLIHTNIGFLSRICGVILVPGVAPSCDKGPFP